MLREKMLKMHGTLKYACKSNFLFICQAVHYKKLNTVYKHITNYFDTEIRHYNIQLFTRLLPLNAGYLTTYKCCQSSIISRKKCFWNKKKQNKSY